MLEHKIFLELFPNRIPDIGNKVTTSALSHYVADVKTIMPFKSVHLPMSRGEYFAFQRTFL
jgi:hypothetical protein